MNLLELPFDSGDIPREYVLEMAAALRDPSFAGAIYAKGKRTLEQHADSWVPRITLLAAHRLNREHEFLPYYGEFLNWMDGQSKQEWYRLLSDKAPHDDMYSQSGEVGIPFANLQGEFQRLFDNLGSPEDGHILDIGCAGGLWAINLAKHGYRVIGTDKHPGLIEQARANARNLGVEDKTQFLVDDACASRLPPEHYSSRVLCMAVTPCLADDAAFHALIAHLDQVSRAPSPSGRKRMVVLGGNRWGMHRVTVVNDILELATRDYPLASARLAMIEMNWWMHLHHLEALKKLFPEIVLIGERQQKLDGVREDFLLQ